MRPTPSPSSWRHVAISGDILHCLGDGWGRYHWRLVGRGQGCYNYPVMHRTVPQNQELSERNVDSAKAKKPWSRYSTHWLEAFTLSLLRTLCRLVLAVNTGTEGKHNIYSPSPRSPFPEPVFLVKSLTNHYMQCLLFIVK